MELHFNECFLESEMRVEACSSIPDIGTHDAEFLNIQVVQAEFRRDADAPVHRLERSIAMKQIKAETKGLVELELVAIPEKSASAGLCGTNGRGGGHSSSIEESFRGTGEIEEN